MKKKSFRILGHFEIYIHCNCGSSTNFNATTKYAFFTFSGMGSSLSNYLGMAVTLKSAVRVLELADFPDEIIIKVFVSLDSKDLLNCGQVSKRFRRISQDEFLWQRIDLSGKSVSAAFIQFILERGCKYLDISNSYILEVKPTQNIFNNCAKLTELNLENTKISEEEYLFLVQNLTSKMKKLKLGTLYNKNPDEHIKILVKRCNQLQELCLKYYRYITNTGITSVIEELKNTLETLDLYPCKNISHSQLLKLKEMPKLKSLSTRNKWLRIGRTLNAYEGFGFVVL